MTTIIKQLVKSTKLSKNELRDIRTLIDVCKREDNFTTKVYWHILKDRKIPEFDDFFLYINGNIIGYLGLFVFKENQAELSALIHPKFRRQGHFSKLFKEAVHELSARNIDSILFLCNKDVEPGETVVKKFGAERTHAEIEMTVTKDVTIYNMVSSEIREAKESDIMDLAKMDHEGFGSDFEKMVFRFMKILKEKDRKVWVCVVDGKNVGKMHIRFDEMRNAHIHDLAIPKDLRRKGYATTMVMNSVEKLKKMGCKKIYLDVEEDNQSAIKLYEKCGFEITAVHNFWKFPINKTSSE